MDYYDELGLSRTASHDEIRHAYRQLARLIHPDQQSDEHLRRLAEIQMKRLNRILEVLTDPVQRREYDRGLVAATALVRIPPQPHPPAPGVIAEWLSSTNRGVWIWVGASLVGIAAISTFVVASGTRPVPVPKVPSYPLPQPFVMTRRQQPTAQAVQATPSSLVRPPLELRQPASDDSEPELPPAPDIVNQPASAVSLLPIPPLEQPRSFAGAWFYTPDPSADKAKGMYDPEYIELKISGAPDRISGLYRARFLVSDRAVSPAVVFHFEGSAAAPSATLHWTGSGGASGTVTLKLVSENSLEVKWTAVHLSDDIGLVSGYATLVRRKDP